jgi:hypothetical protein
MEVHCYAWEAGREAIREACSALHHFFMSPKTFQTLTKRGFINFQTLQEYNKMFRSKTSWLITIKN